MKLNIMEETWPADLELQDNKDLSQPARPARLLLLREHKQLFHSIRPILARVITIIADMYLDLGFLRVPRHNPTQTQSS